MRVLLFCLGILLITLPEILRVYYIMPFPGSQEDVATDLRQVNIAYWLHKNIWWVRLVGAALLIGPFVHYMKRGGLWRRLAVLVPVAFGVLVIYAFNFRFMADKMFLPPNNVVMQQPVSTDSTGNDLVIVVEQNGDARAYPVELIGYHHQVSDTVGGKQVLVTYCTVCRTGRAWDPSVDGEQEHFRLVGMDHFNAMFEDSRTGSWWRQATGECVAGPLKGEKLEEIPSQQTTRVEFAQQHPKGLVMMPDSGFLEQYRGLANFDEGTIDSHLEYHDTASWQKKSWVVGVVHDGNVRAYDWNEIMAAREFRTAQDVDPLRVFPAAVLIDTLGGDPICIVLDESGTAMAYRCTWVPDTAARLYDSVLPPPSVFLSKPIPAYQEFWHSWRTFHPNTTRYAPKR